MQNVSRYSNSFPAQKKGSNSINWVHVRVALYLTPEGQIKQVQNQLHAYPRPMFPRTNFCLAPNTFPLRASRLANKTLPRTQAQTAKGAQRQGAQRGTDKAWAWQAFGFGS